MLFVTVAALIAAIVSHRQGPSWPPRERPPQPAWLLDPPGSPAATQHMGTERVVRQGQVTDRGDVSWIFLEGSRREDQLAHFRICLLKRDRPVLGIEIWELPRPDGDVKHRLVLTGFSFRGKPPGGSRAGGWKGIVDDLLNRAFFEPGSGPGRSRSWVRARIVQVVSIGDLDRGEQLLEEAIRLQVRPSALVLTAQRDGGLDDLLRSLEETGDAALLEGVGSSRMLEVSDELSGLGAGHATMEDVATLMARRFYQDIEDLGGDAEEIEEGLLRATMISPETDSGGLHFWRSAAYFLRPASKAAAGGLKPTPADLAAVHSVHELRAERPRSDFRLDFSMATDGELVFPLDLVLSWPETSILRMQLLQELFASAYLLAWAGDDLGDLTEGLL